VISEKDLLAHHLCAKKEKETTDRWVVRFYGRWL